jgi:hypothetical protein
MKKKIIGRFILFSCFISLQPVAWSQPEILWDSAFGTSNLYNFGVSQITADDGIVFEGLKTEGPGILKLWIRKYDAAGNKNWDKIFSEDPAGEMKSIRQTPDGGYLLSGKILGENSFYNLWILKLNSDGDSIWSKLYAIGTYAIGDGICMNTDGSCLIHGQAIVTDNGQVSMLVLRINQDGDTLWTKTYDNAMSYQCQSLTRCDQGGYAAVGVIDSTGEEGFYYQIIRFDENGDTLWTKAPSVDYAIHTIYPTSDNGFILTGMQCNGNDWDLLLYKTDGDGKKEWSKAFGADTWEMGYDVRQTEDGGYIIAGTTSAYGTGGGLDAWLIKTDSKGNKIWWDTYGGAEDNERAFQVFITADNGYYVTGNVRHLFWVARLATDTAKAIPTGTKSLIHSDEGFCMNYPNPFNNTTTIEYKVPDKTNITVAVFNLAGQEIIQLVKQTLPGGYYSTSWDGKDRQGNFVTPGIYYYQISLEDKLTKKTSCYRNKMVYCR